MPTCRAAGLCSCRPARLGSCRGALILGERIGRRGCGRCRSVPTRTRRRARLGSCRGALVLGERIGRRGCGRRLGLSGLRCAARISRLLRGLGRGFWRRCHRGLRGLLRRRRSGPLSAVALACRRLRGLLGDLRRGLGRALRRLLLGLLRDLRRGPGSALRRLLLGLLRDLRLGRALWRLLLGLRGRARRGLRLRLLLGKAFASLADVLDAVAIRIRGERRENTNRQHGKPLRSQFHTSPLRLLLTAPTCPIAPIRPAKKLLEHYFRCDESFRTDTDTYRLPNRMPCLLRRAPSRHRSLLCNARKEHVRNRSGPARRLRRVA